MFNVQDKHGCPLLDSTGHPILCEQSLGKLILHGASKQIGSGWLIDNHGKRVTNSRGFQVLWIDTPPGQAYFEEERIRHAQWQFEPPTDAEVAEFHKDMMENWQVQRWRYFEGRRVDVTTVIHAARCGDLDFLVWLKEQGKDEDLRDPDVLGHAHAHNHSHIVEWLLAQ